MIVIVSDDGRYPLQMVFDKQEIVVGRDGGCDIVLPSTDVSTRHARMTRRDGGVLLRDLGSTNGTTVNGRKLEHPLRLDYADIIRIGRYLLQVRKSLVVPWS